MLSYPVQEVIPQLKQALKKNNIVILQAPPGAGKSTIVPLELLKEFWLADKKILLLEPRRMAAKAVAYRMASLLNEDIGKTVGYRVRFEVVVSSHTRIEVVTEGILTRILQNDNALEDVGLILFDEFHERSLAADLALTLCYQILQVLRSDLRIMIMSATLDGEKISSQLNQAPIITSQGRQYPISLKYQAIDKSLSLIAQTSRAIRLAFKEQTGDLLVFLPGAGEIRRLQEELSDIGAVVLPLYGDLSLKKQQDAMVPDAQGRRKVVLATSIAETSLTIEGITTVVDSGFSRMPRFDPRSGFTRLETIRVTKDVADQRAGRAGRIGSGVAYRLWPESMHHQLIANRQPEIMDADLSSLLLELRQWGIHQVDELNWITPPPPGAIGQATELLEQLGAIKNNKITARGREMLQLPTHPRIAHLLLEAFYSVDSIDMSLSTDIASLLEERDPLPKESGADLSMRVEILRKWRSGTRVNADQNILDRIEILASYWRKKFKINADNSIPADSDVGRLLISAYPERIAQQIDKHQHRYKLANGRIVALQDHDPLRREPWLAVAQLDGGHGEGKIFLAAPLNTNDFTHLAKEKEVIRWDRERGQVVATKERQIGTVTLSFSPLPKINEEERVNVLVEAFQEEGLKLLSWDEEVLALQSRILSLKKWRPLESWPDLNEETLISTAKAWLPNYLQGVNKRQDFKRLNSFAILMGLLPWDLSNNLDTLAPAKIEVPSGSMIRIRYFPDGRLPVLEVRLQEVFGLLETPTINEGKTPILLHLLSPGYKPVQITRDLKSFWSTTYHQVRKELRIRYQKHHWPEDPWTATAVKGAKKRLS